MTTPREPDADADSAVATDRGVAASVVADPKLSLIARSRMFLEGSKTRAAETVERFEKQRSDNRIIDAAFGSVETDAQTGGDLLAGAVSFRYFLLFVPYVFVIILGLGVGGDLAGKSPAEIASSSGMGGLVASTVRINGEFSRSFHLISLLVVLYALVSGARKLLRSLMSVHSVIWRVPFVKLRRSYLGGVVLILIMTAAAVAAHFIARLQNESVITWLLALIAFIAIPAATWLICSVRVFPSAPGATWKDLWPGAVLFGLGTEVLHVVTVVWIAHSLESKSETYGTLGAALTILLWAYAMGRIVTASVALNVAVWNNSHRSSSNPKHDPYSSS